MTGRVVIGEVWLTIDELAAVAAGAVVELDAVARARINESRAVVEETLAADAPVYGLNTQLGHGKDERVAAAELRHYQELVVRGHDGGFGPPLPRETVRAAMVTRLNGIARGGAGASPAVADILAELLNRGVHPIVPTTGSVGASDLMHMAAIAMVAIGRGRAEVSGEVVDGAEALRRAGLAPLELGPKDAIAFISANGVSIGRAALVVRRAARLADAADVAAALSLEAMAGNPSIVDEAAASAKPVAGQAVAAEHLRRLLRGSAINEPGGPASVQDALSFRVAPQVHGAYRELLSIARGAVEGELNAMDDNPLVSIAERRMLSTGNFHPIFMALVMDALRPAIVHVAQLSDRRTGHLWDRLAGDPGSLATTFALLVEESSGALLRYAGAAAVAELRGIAGPATLDVGPLDRNVEDHATAAPLTVARTDDALGLLADVLAVELLVARDVFLVARRRGETFPRLGAGTGAALAHLDGLLAEGPTGRAAGRGGAAAAHAAVRGALEGAMLDAAQAGAMGGVGPTA